MASLFTKTKLFLQDSSLTWDDTKVKKNLMIVYNHMLAEFIDEFTKYEGAVGGIDAEGRGSLVSASEVPPVCHGVSYSPTPIVSAACLDAL